MFIFKILIIIIMMTETISIKRKDFTVLEHLGEHSFKVKRKGKIYFLKQYKRREDFDSFVKNSHRLKITAIDIPKVYLFDKDKMISVVDYIDGDNIFDLLVNDQPINEDVFKFLMQDEWYARKERVRINLTPDCFKFNGKKLYYLSYQACVFESNYDFIMKDFRLWFITQDFIRYAASKGVKIDEKRLGNEYATNKQIALMAVKYYL